MIILIFILTVCVYANIAHELDDDKPLDYEPSISRELIALHFLKNSIAPLFRDSFLQVSFAFEDCNTVTLSVINDPSYFFFHQALCGKMKGMYINFAEEDFFFEFLIQLQKLMQSK